MLEILISLTLGVMITASIFNLVIDTDSLSKQEEALTTVQDNLRFMHFYLRRKIHEAANWSCVTRQPDLNAPIVQAISSDIARRDFGAVVVKNSNALLLRECVRITGHTEYLPILFFLGDTYRRNERSQKIMGLFMKIGNHPREELLSGISAFHVAVKTDLADVEIHLTLQYESPVFRSAEKPYFYLSDELYANTQQ